MCEKRRKEDPNLAAIKRRHLPSPAMDLKSLLERLGEVIRSLPTGTWSLVIHVDAPERFELL